MLNNKKIAVVVPAYNEEKQIEMVIESMPEFVDRIVIINDCSTDKTEEIVKNYITRSKKSNLKIKAETKEIIKTLYNEADVFLHKMFEEEEKSYIRSNLINKNYEKDRIILISHTENGGKGAATATGYKWCRDMKIDCTAIMDGDGQMDPDELKSLCLPIVEDDIDYVKGNRLIHRASFYIIPKIRFLGNSILSMMTKVASGYWHVSDSQTGYTAISLRALNGIDIHKLYKRYGVPNDVLVRLNIAGCTVKEVPIKPVYCIGEESKMKIRKVIPQIGWLLVKSFFRRIWIKYFLRDLHPLFLFYHFAILLFLIWFPILIYIIYEVLLKWGSVSIGFYMVFILLFISCMQSVFFAMWMDIQDNERLYK